MGTVRVGPTASGRRRTRCSSRISTTLVIIVALFFGFAVGLLIGTTLHVTSEQSIIEPTRQGGTSTTSLSAAPNSNTNSRALDLSSTTRDSEYATQKSSSILPPEKIASYRPDYSILGVRVESRKNLPASSIPGSTWYDVPNPQSNMDHKARVAMQRTHMIEAFEKFLPIACRSSNDWFLWLEDDVTPFPGSLLRVGGIVLALRERHIDAGGPAFVRLGVGLTAALLRCQEAQTILLDELRSVDMPVDHVVANSFNGKTLNYETALFGHSDSKGGSTIQALPGRSDGASRSGNEMNKLLLSTNLGGPRFAFDSTGCLGYAWSPCPTRGGLWAPTSFFDWFGERSSARQVGAETHYGGNSWSVVHGNSVKENCDDACARYGSKCDEAGLSEINNPLTLRERSGVACDGVYYRPVVVHAPAFALNFAISDHVQGTACYLNLRQPRCGGKMKKAVTFMSPNDRRICTCAPISITKYDARALETRKIQSTNIFGSNKLRMGKKTKLQHGSNN